MQNPLFAWLGPLYLLAVAVPLSVIDIRQRRLPNKLVLPGFLVVWLAQLADSIRHGDFTSMGLATVCALGMFALALIANRIGALGMGDVKLLALIGQSFGWWGLGALSVAVVSGILLAAVFVLVALAVRRLSATSTIPLGPYLLASCLLATVQLCFSEGVVSLPA